MPSCSIANHGISSLFHANASEAKPCRSESLRCTTFPSQITSALFSAIPLLCHPLGAVPCHRYATLRFSFALPVCASQCRREAVGRNTLPLHSSSPHSLRFAALSNAFAVPFASARYHAAAELNSSHPRTAIAKLIQALPRLCQSTLSNAFAARNHSQPCLCLAQHCLASANPGRQCHALALRPSPHRRCR